MASSPLADPSRFVISAAVGFRHVLEAVLGFLERVTSRHECNPVVLVLVVLLALMALMAYLLLAAAVFVVSVAVYGYTRIVVERGDVTRPELEQAAAALSPAAVLGCLGNLAIKLALAGAVISLMFGVVLYMSSNVMLAARN